MNDLVAPTQYEESVEVENNIINDNAKRTSSLVFDEIRLTDTNEEKSNKSSEGTKHTRKKSIFARTSAFFGFVESDEETAKGIQYVHICSLIYFLE